MQSYYDELFEYVRKRSYTKLEFTKLKTRLSKKHRLMKIPTDIDVMLHAPKEMRPSLGFLKQKPMRTVSGVTVCSLMTKPESCPHGRCIMCPGGPGSVFGDVPQSYTGREPATMRAIRNDFSAYRQIMGRLAQYAIGGHDFSKVEVIIQGGTFPAYSWTYQRNFVRDIFQALNDFGREFVGNGLRLDELKDFFELRMDFKSPEREKKVRRKLIALQKRRRSTLEDEQHRNERSPIRCVGLTIETKPDWALQKHADRMLQLGCTRIELGFQTDDETVLRTINRGHGIKESIDSTRILKDHAFKINYHVMLGLPRTTPASDRKMLSNLFANPDYRPDMLKIYPCMVMPGTPLYTIWKKGKFEPMTTKTAVKLISSFLPDVPEYVRIMRVQRDIPTSASVAGVDRTNLRQYLPSTSRDIRSREIGHVLRDSKRRPGKAIIKLTEYDSSGGKEFFIAYEHPVIDAIAGYCRMRFPGASMRLEITDSSALIRELHVMGTAVPIGKVGKVQHTGIGKKLMQKAESIARANGKDKMVVISGIGVREYYRKLGYRLEGAYMVKKMKK